jgi:methyl-accepting chemotaxis protein
MWPWQGRGNRERDDRDSPFRDEVPVPTAEEPPEAAPDLRSIRARVLEEIDERHGLAAAQIADVEKYVESEVMTCGQVLSAIVDNARDMVAETEQAVAESVSETEAMTSRFVADIEQDVLAQDAAVRRLSSLADNIEEAAKAINDLTQSATLLALNARIEAARMGEKGAAFGVIAQHMSDLSKTIEATASQVGAAIEAVRDGLPPVTGRAASMQRRTHRFIEEIEAHVTAASRRSGPPAEGGGHLEQVIELSNEGLSHLQFHDPMVKKLDGIDRMFETLSERAGLIMDGREVAPESPVPRRGDAEPPPGDVLLF